MLVIDNFFHEDLINAVILEANEQDWRFIRGDSNQDLYWTRFIFGITHFKNSNVLEKFASKNVEKCWEFFKSKTNCGLDDNNLYSVYFNGMTHGIEAHAHVDNFEENHTTVIIYVCSNWNSHWGGETAFFNGEYSENPADNIYYSHDIVKSVCPKYNRIVLFDSKIVHAVRPISKSFKGLRATLMFKIKNKGVEEFKNLCS